MNISKTIAENIANKMVAQMNKKKTEEEDNLKEYVTEIALKQTPKIILEAYQKYPNYFQCANQVNILNGSCMHNYLDVKYRAIPYKPNSYNNFQCDNEQFDYIAKKREDIVKLNDEIRSVRNSIIDTLLSLRTIKKVIENFPEAAEYAKEYEKTNSALPALPIDTIRKTLKKYNDK